MKRLLNWIFGFLLAFLGAGLGVWIAYNLLVEMQPLAKGKSPVGASFLAVGFVAAGVSRLRKAQRQRGGEAQ